ncbi:MAG: hypothetical protein JJU45_13020 [Acidimicrobiia bacterium]|nr:hypothetical protein [Acidimicrobiia bacterium]
MTVLADVDVRKLAELRGGAGPIVTCYLDVDGRHHARVEDCHIELDRALSAANGSVPPEDARRLRDHLSTLDRSNVRGVALFSGADDGIWAAVHLPIAVRSRVVVNNAPALAQLEAVLAESERVGLVLCDRQRARLLVFELGQVIEAVDVDDDLPRDVDTVGHRDHGEPTAHTEEMVAQHVRRVARRAFEVFEQRGVRHVVLGVPDALVAELESDLHPYVRERVRERTHLRVDTPAGELREYVLAAEHRFEATRTGALVDLLRQEVHRGGKGLAGLAASLEAVVDSRAEHLLVSEGYSDTGWHCATCGMLAAVGRSCPRCGSEMSAVPDVVEDVIDLALQHGCSVEVCPDAADLDVLGRIGVLLRF